MGVRSSGGSLARCGLRVDRMPWTEASDFGGYRSRPAAGRLGLSSAIMAIGSACSIGMSASVFPWPTRSSAAALEQRQGLSCGTCDKGVPTVPTLAVEALRRRRCSARATALRQRGWCKAAGLGERLRHLPARPDGPDSGRSARLADARPAMARGHRRVPANIRSCYFDGEFSHAVVKVPKPRRISRPAEYGGIIAAAIRRPARSSWRKQRWPRRLRQAPMRASTSWWDNDGSLQIMELELIEPALFLDRAPDGGSGFRAAMRSAAERATE